MPQIREKMATTNETFYDNMINQPNSTSRNAMALRNKTPEVLRRNNERDETDSRRSATPKRVMNRNFEYTESAPRTPPPELNGNGKVAHAIYSKERDANPQREEDQRTAERPKGGALEQELIKLQQSQRTPGKSARKEEETVAYSQSQAKFPKPADQLLLPNVRFLGGRGDSTSLNYSCTHISGISGCHGRDICDNCLRRKISDARSEALQQAQSNKLQEEQAMADALRDHDERVKQKLNEKREYLRRINEETVANENNKFASRFETQKAAASIPREQLEADFGLPESIKKEKEEQWKRELARENGQALEKQAVEEEQRRRLQKEADLEADRNHQGLPVGKYNPDFRDLLKGALSAQMEEKQQIKNLERSNERLEGAVPPEQYIYERPTSQVEQEQAKTKQQYLEFRAVEGEKRKAALIEEQERKRGNDFSERREDEEYMRKINERNASLDAAERQKKRDDAADMKSHLTNQMNDKSRCLQNERDSRRNQEQQESRTLTQKHKELEEIQKENNKEFKLKELALQKQSFDAELAQKRNTNEFDRQNDKSYMQGVIANERAKIVQELDRKQVYSFSLILNVFGGWLANRECKMTCEEA